MAATFSSCIQFSLIAAFYSLNLFSLCLFMRYLICFHSNMLTVKLKISMQVTFINNTQVNYLIRISNAYIVLYSKTGTSRYLLFTRSWLIMHSA